MDTTIDIPWVEKYRPPTLKEVQGHESISRIIELVSNGNMPHLMLEGPAGTGKTTTALAIVNDLFGHLPGGVVEKIYKELNASDARGIDVVRTSIKDFIKVKKHPLAPFKILILDEADNMTGSAQQALRRLMERHSKNCRLILICNYSNKIIPPIQSRCVVIHFKPLDSVLIEKRVLDISAKEGVDLPQTAADAIAYAASGDMRRAINILQAVSMLGDGAVIEDSDIYRITGTVDRREIRELISASRESLTMGLDKLEGIIASGVPGKEVARQIFAEIKESDIDPSERIRISACVSDALFRISVGCSEALQLRGLVSEISGNRGESLNRA